MLAEQMALAIIGSIISSLVMAGLVRLAFIGSRARAEKCGSRKVIRYHWSLKGLITVGFTVLVMATVHIYQTTDPDERYMALFPAALVLLFTAGLLHLFGNAVEFDRTTIWVQSPWSDSRRVPLANLLGYRYDEDRKLLLLYPARGKPLKISSYMAGFQDLADQLMEHFEAHEATDERPGSGIRDAGHGLD